MIRRIDHVGIAVRGFGERLAFWSEALGLPIGGFETVAGEQVRVAFLSAGDSRLELLEPTGADSPVARSIDKRGEGLHHLTLAVDDLAATLARLEAHGVGVLGGTPRCGAGGRAVAFLHPRDCGGVLVELVEEGGRAAEAATIAPGAAVLLYLREPQEKFWGVLRRLDPAGVIVEGIDLNSFDDWVSQLEREEESVVGPSLLFLPMARIERVLLDRASGPLPSLADRFERRTGRTVQEVLAQGGDAPADPGPGR